MSYSQIPDDAVPVNYPIVSRHPKLPYIVHIREPDRARNAVPDPTLTGGGAAGRGIHCGSEIGSLTQFAV
jgi:hypothetical protein